MDLTRRRWRWRRRHKPFCWLCIWDRRPRPIWKWWDCKASNSPPATCDQSGTLTEPLKENVFRVFDYLGYNIKLSKHLSHLSSFCPKFPEIFLLAPTSQSIFHFRTHVICFFLWLNEYQRDKLALAKHGSSTVNSLKSKDYHNWLGARRNSSRNVIFNSPS